MQQNWYILYTKAGGEKKVAASLSKRKIEHFLPLCAKAKNNPLNRVSIEPLFTGYVFIRIASAQLLEVQQAVGALSIVYWKGKPVIIPAEDINEMKDFTATYDTIRLVPVKMNANNRAKEVEPPALVINETLASVKRRSLVLSIPSLGYTLVAESRDTMLSDYVTNAHSGEKMLN